MRTLMRITVPVEAGNKAIHDGTLQKIIQESMDRLKPEAAYFFSEHGVRASLYVFDLQDPSDIPAIAEPFFIGLNASVEFTPVMSADDLKQAFGKL